MQRILNWLRLAFPSRPAARGRRAVRPQLERLDDRLVLSATSAITTTHQWGGYSYTTHDLYAIDNYNRVLDYGTSPWGHSTIPLGAPPNTGVSDVSASVDPGTGNAEVFALGQDHRLYLCDPNGTWHNFGGSYKGLSATRDGQVYAVTSDGSDVRLVNGNGNATDLGAPDDGTGPYASRSIAASVGWFGGDEVFAIGGGGEIYVNSAGSSGGWRLVDRFSGNSPSFQTLAGGPNDEVFALDSNGHLWQESEHFATYRWYGYFYWSHQDISGGLTYKALSADRDAAGNDEVYALTTDNTLYLHDQGSWQWRDSYVSAVSGADGGYFFDVNFGPVWAYDPNAGGSRWTRLGDLSTD
jgi:hypothetical protein